MSEIQQFSNFEVETLTSKNPFTGEEKTTQTLIFRRSLDCEIIESIKQILESDDEMYNDPIRLAPNDFYPHLKTITNKVSYGDDYLIELSFWLNDYFKDRIEQLERMSQDGKINFSNLESIINIGSKCIGKILDQDIGFIISRTERGVDSNGVSFYAVTGKVTIAFGDKFKQFDKNFIIQQFRGALSPDQLPVRPITEEETLKLTLRGAKLIKYGMSGTYVAYSGNMFRKTPYGIYKFRADGRIMIDPTGFMKKYPSYDHFRGLVDCESVPDDLLFMCYPFVYGFSFTTKEWGEVYINDVSDVVFNEGAFDMVVLDANTKEMVKALITHSDAAFSDIITGKSKATIFCLDGTPGVGKTLLSESICEYLHKPLYSVTVGELGTSPEKLEQKLNEILEIAYAWNAVILLDEADIFMEKRASNDLNRNAMVSVFLRLLERYQGIMFLTTNRIDDFDVAFKSRISISIHYDELSELSRYQVWKNLLSASKIELDDVNVSELSQIKLNGRQIKNCIRMAQCLAKSKNQVMSKEIVEQVVPFIM
jgi:hypothetical protein